jgi:hypothetical protein
MFSIWSIGPCLVCVGEAFVETNKGISVALHARAQGTKLALEINHTNMTF